MREGNGTDREGRSVKVVLAGNPNAGKTSLFNALTGARQKVANYPGVTVECKRGYFYRGGRRFEVVDLPGTYSLTSFSPEEVIARREIWQGKPDVTVVVVDSTNLERSLYLLVQIMELGANPILCLNMSDEAHRAGQRVDLRQMQRLLGFPVVETVGHRETGVDRLKVLVDRAASRPPVGSRLVLGERLKGVLERLRSVLHETHLPPEAPPGDWMLIKLIESDPEMIRWVREHLEPEEAEELLHAVEGEKARIMEETGMDPALFVADRRYGFIYGLLREVRTVPPREDAHYVSDRIDAFLCHRLFGFPVFLAVIYAVFWVTFSLGDYPVHGLEACLDALSGLVRAHWSPETLGWVRSLVLDGIIAGVGGVLVFLPNILLLFFGLAFLEDTGYMARAAFLMDNILHRFGLHGKSFIPMITGFGCSIPGIMATRTLENERDRLTTMLVLPLMSCGARLPAYMLLIPAFFPEEARTPMLWLIYMIGILLAVGLAKLLRSTLLSGEEAPFVMELPPYRLPTLKAVLLKMWDRSSMYLQKAGTVILGVSVLMWFLSTFPRLPEEGGAEPLSAAVLSSTDDAVRRSEALRYSFAGRLGRILEPALAPMGFDWRIATGLLGAFTAKEVFVSQMGIVFALGDTEEGEGGGGFERLQDVLRRNYTPLTAFCLMLFLLIATPCMATVAVVKQESGRWRWALLQFFGLTAIAWILATLVYQVGRLLGMG